jgi:hypothetical protein
MARVACLGSVFKVDDDDSGGSYTTITLLLDFQRPSRVRERIENTALEDTLATEGAGIEIAGDATFTYFSDPGSTQDTIFRTLFANKTQVLWQMLYADNGTETFEGIVMGCEPQPSARNEYWKEKITIARQTASTFA